MSAITTNSSVITFPDLGILSLTSGDSIIRAISNCLEAQRMQHRLILHIWVDFLLAGFSRCLSVVVSLCLAFFSVFFPQCPRRETCTEEEKKQAQLFLIQVMLVPSAPYLFKCCLRNVVVHPFCSAVLFCFCSIATMDHIYTENFYAWFRLVTTVFQKNTCSLAVLVLSCRHSTSFASVSDQVW